MPFERSLYLQLTPFTSPIDQSIMSPAKMILLAFLALAVPGSCHRQPPPPSVFSRAAASMISFGQLWIKGGREISVQQDTIETRISIIIDILKEKLETGHAMWDWLQVVQCGNWDGLILRRNGQLLNKAFNCKSVSIRILSYLLGRSLWFLELIRPLQLF